MNIFRDKQIKHFSLFIAIYSILLVGVSTWFSINQLNTAKSMYLEHDRAIVSALLEQEVSKEVIANAISSTDISTAGRELPQIRLVACCHIFPSFNITFCV